MSNTLAINKFCPNISHEHRKSYNNSERKKCFICSPNLELEFHVPCPNYRQYQNVKLSYNIKLTLQIIFSQKNNSFYLPKELEEYIILILETPIPKTEYTMDNSFLEHASKCKPCATVLLNLLEKNSCARHIVPRASTDRFRLNLL
tara:strand:- start:90 stop:527 length:438 start_codon:yes stop_codon:yes gene_type:complete